MNLGQRLFPEEETMNDQCDRRDFVKIGAAAGAAWAMGREGLAADASDVKAPPIENVRVGIVGIGNRGTFLLRLLLEQEGVEVKAVCDWLEVHRLIRALQTGTPPDMDVYDAAAWSCITELSEKSVADRSRPMDFPDFTHGRWKTTPPIGIIGQ
jgi:hypothetical protein